jgi:hypothetical protein
VSPRHLLGGHERERYGAIVSALVDGRIRTVHRVGLTNAAIEECIEVLESYGEHVVVLAISTPDTIYRDLKGPRTCTTTKPNPGLQLPEPAMLTRIGRGDLIDMNHRRKQARRWPWQRRKRIRLHRNPNPQCRGTTARGQRCKFHALPGSRHCAYHQK